jgi:hypothetical protein
MQVCRKFLGESVYPTKTTLSAIRFLTLWVGEGIKEGLTPLLTPGDCKSSPPGYPNPTEFEEESGSEV